MSEKHDESEIEIRANVALLSGYISAAINARAQDRSEALYSVVLARPGRLIIRALASGNLYDVAIERLSDEAMQALGGMLRGQA